MSNTAKQSSNVSELKPKPTGRIATLEREVAELRWCFAELIWMSKVAAAQQAMANPQFQEQIRNALMAQMGTNPTAILAQ